MWPSSSRVRRADPGSSRSGFEDPLPIEINYNLHKEGGVPCILAEMDATFTVEYWTTHYGKQKATVSLPDEVTVKGRCVMNGYNAVLSLLWDRYNFTLMFTETAERDMYYLNKAILEYEQVRYTVSTP